ncbi:MAG: bifunctional 4-hydroxy-2-oxoglutarate aldolase/2-dehydro-3-deoxy-phosphogluconate aldolase [Burkholderiales bacterium]|nr:bifunctional 4-hydroxy-2-oxoglutarate aldolase/2-dehydro-3-deoxy-phosphogluconate aldolase [Burkholderiales bacterium]
MTPVETADRLAKYRLIPVIRYDKADDGALAIECALRAGFPTVEVTLTMPDAADLVREFARHLESHQLIGAGTVWNADDCARVLDAGAAYVVSPGLVPGLGAQVHAGRAAYLPGALTPGEVAAALRDGADIVKLFPASSLGPKHLAAVGSVFPGVRFCPTGGITGENMEQWFAAGATCVGIGSSLFSRAALAARNQKLLVEEARHHLSLLSLIPR